MKTQNQKLSRVTAVVASVAAGSSLPAQPQEESPKPEGSVTTTLNDQAELENRFQLKFSELSFTSEFTDDFSSLDSLSFPPQQLHTALAWQQENLRLDGAFVRNEQGERFRVGGALSPSDSTELGVTLAFGDDRSHVAGFFQQAMAENTKLGFSLDSEGDWRSRLLIGEDNLQTAISIGQQNDEEIFSFSAHTEHLWLVADYNSASGTSAQFVIGDIDSNRTDKFSRFTHQGRADLSDIPDIELAPSRFDVGTSPSFLYGGRSILTFLGQESGDAAGLIGWQEDQTFRIEGALRLGDIAFLNSPYVSAGITTPDFFEENHYFTQLGGSVGSSDLSIKLNMDDSGELSAGILWSIRF